MSDSPSPFYDQFVGAAPFTLVFPSVDFAGPHWGDDGELIRTPSDELATEGIEAVQLDSIHYRLACRSDGPFSCLRLHWGDEFMAEAAGDGSLALTQVVMPQAFVHQRFLTSAPFDNDMPIAKLVHELGGGWEAVAGGMLTITVPAGRLLEFQRFMTVARIKPGTARTSC